jgi:putative ABC transport system permease protein
MISLALKMLIGNMASFIGAVFGIFLATLLISQQSAIFLGVVARSYRIVTDIPYPNIWVVDPATESEDKLRKMPESSLDVIRSTPGIEWAGPINVSHISLTTGSGIFEVGKLYGIDDATLIGAPTQMVEGQVRDLHREGGVIIDVYSANSLLAKTLPNGIKVPLKIGDEIEINNRRAIIIGLCKITQGFYPQPILFTTYQEFIQFTSLKRSFSFIAAKTVPNLNVYEVCKRINRHPGLDALTREQFKNRIIRYFLKTGILINFALSVGLGFIIGLSIAGQIFYSLTVNNLVYYALIKALGGTKRVILEMIIVQALLIGIIGFSLGMGAAILWGMAVKGTTLAFLLPWQLLAFTTAIILIICILTAALSILKVFRVDPKMLMGT